MTPPPEPPRHLGLWDATALYAGIILGSGIFFAPSAIAGATRSGPVAVLLWLAGALVASCGAACYAECASRMPRNGGFFVFHREAFGPGIAFVGGWASMFVTYPASVAAIALVLARYAAEAAGHPGIERPVAAFSLVAAGALNAAGLRAGPLAQRALTSLKLLSLAVLAIAVAVAGLRGGAPPAVATAPASAAVWLPAVLAMLWTYDGWSDITLIAGEVREPERNLGRAVLLGTGLLFVVYALVQLAVMAALPGGAAAASSRPFADAVAAALGPAVGRGVALLVVLSTFGAILGTILTVSRLGAAMAREGALVPALGTVHPGLGTPVRSTLLVTGAALVYVASSSFGTILTYFTFSVWTFYGATAVALVILRRRGVGESGAWRAPLGFVPPAVVLAAGFGLIANIVFEAPRNAAVGAMLLAAGFPVYRLLARRG